VEPEESAEAAAVREALEETGLDVVLDEFLGSALVAGEGSGRYLIYDYAAHCIDTRRSPTPGGDASAARFIPLRRVGELDLVDGLEQWLIDHGVL
jgi:8-oxo-dGTP pyrophosphatase MutT (NUDIX family)